VESLWIVNWLELGITSSQLMEWLLGWGGTGLMDRFRFLGVIRCRPEALCLKG